MITVIFLVVTEESNSVFAQSSLREDRLSYFSHHSLTLQMEKQFQLMDMPSEILH